MSAPQDYLFTPSPLDRSISIIRGSRTANDSRTSADMNWYPKIAAGERLLQLDTKAAIQTSKSSRNSKSSRVTYPDFAKGVARFWERR